MPIKNQRSLKRIILVSLFIPTLFFAVAHAGWQDLLNDWLGGSKEEATTPAETTRSSSYTPTQSDMNRAILDALSVGVKRAIELLGKQDGFLGDAQVRIPMPEDLQTIENLARKLGQDKYADQFITSMNRAAEKAVPQTTQIFVDTIKEMSVQDAEKILRGSDDAATQFFREKTSTQLEDVIKPLVSQTMNDVGVTRHYKKLVSKVDFLGSYVDPETLDLDAYVTRQTVSGLFIKLAEEEKKIRKDPVARSSELLKQVFGYFQ